MDAFAPKHKGVQIKKYFMVFLLTFSNIVYIIPYLSLDFYNQFLDAYKIPTANWGSSSHYSGSRQCQAIFWEAGLPISSAPKKWWYGPRSPLRL